MRREYVWTHDLEGVQNGVIGHGFIDLWHDERLDQSEQFGFEIAADNPKTGLLIRDGELLHRGRRFFITELEDSRQGPVTTVKVEADALWYRLGDLTYPGSFVVEGMTPDAGLQLILRETGWVAGPSTTDTTEFSMEQQDKTRLALLRTWAKITGTSLVFDTAGRGVGVVAARGRELGLAFRYGRNLTGVRRRSRPPELTVLYPYGADDLTVAGINGGVPYVEDFSYYTDLGLDLATARERYTRSKVWSDSSFLVDTDLLAAAETRLALKSQPAISYELKVVDLSEITGNVEDVAVADRVRVFDPDLDEDVRATVTRVRRHRLQPWRNQIELSTSLTALSDGSSTTRPSRSAEWHQFVGPVRAAYVIRNDGDYITNRIALAFREGGRANYHLDLFATGVGAGTMNVTVLDFENGQEVQRQQLDVPYTNGGIVRVSLDWAREELLGSYDYRVRVTTTASGGPSTTNGVNIAADANDEASFYIMAQGAIQETPTEPNSIRFDFTGAMQSWTVPDGVTQATIRTVAAEGGGALGIEGKGSAVTATFTLIPGTLYDIEVGGKPTSRAGGWPGGGDGGENVSASIGHGGGGRSSVRPVGAALTGSVVVAGAGGGRNNGGFGTGGDGRFFVGEDAAGGETAATGATQFAAGTAGGAGQGQGGDGLLAQGGFRLPGGGGGDGYFGGGANDPVTNGSPGGPCGAGGSGYIDPVSGYFDLLLEDGTNTGHGFIEISWDIPI